MKLNSQVNLMSAGTEYAWQTGDGIFEFIKVNDRSKSAGASLDTCFKGSIALLS